MQIRGVIKKLKRRRKEDWCSEIDIYLVMYFVGDIKQQIFYQL